ncbi:MAG: ATPase, T2SS/T4P/T4SS family [Granulosicoccus sp.]
MHNALAASAVLPHHETQSGVVDLRSRLHVCSLDERQAWEALQNELLQALQLHSHEMHIDCETECLKIRTNTLSGSIETRLAADNRLIQALRLLEQQPWSNNAKAIHGRAWFLTRLQERDHFYQLDHIQSSSGSAYTLRLLYDAQNPLPQLDQLFTLRGQSNCLRERLNQTDGLILLADVDRVRRVRTARAIAQYMTSPNRRILLSETTCHPLVPGINQLTLPLEANSEHHLAWQQACNMSYDLIIALEITHDPVSLTRLATENCKVVQGVCANNASKALAQLLATGTRPEAVARALTSIIIQHPVALACERCKRSANISHELNNWIARKNPMQPDAINEWLHERLSDSFVQTEGCDQCNQTGVGQVILIAECVDLSRDIQDALYDGDIRYAIDNLVSSDQLPSQLIKLSRNGKITIDQAINRLNVYH